MAAPERVAQPLLAVPINMEEKPHSQEWLCYTRNGNYFGLDGLPLIFTATSEPSA